MGRDAKLYQTFMTKVGEARREMTYFGEATVNARWSAFDTQDFHCSQWRLPTPKRLEARQKRPWGIWRCVGMSV